MTKFSLTGKKKFWKTGPKPSHPKGKRMLIEGLVDFINEHDERIINGASRKLVAGDYLCTTCFEIEESSFTLHKQSERKGNCYSANINCGSDNPMDSPFDQDYIQVEQSHAKEKLNEVFQSFGLPTIEDM